jgi:hypothetical protein
VISWLQEYLFSKCNFMFRYNKECQTADWRAGHKGMCKPYARGVRKLNQSADKWFLSVPGLFLRCSKLAWENRRRHPVIVVQTSHSGELHVEVGLHTSHAVDQRSKPHGFNSRLKLHGFNPRTYKVINQFQNLLSNATCLYRYVEMIPRSDWETAQGGAVQVECR